MIVRLWFLSASLLAFAPLWLSTGPASALANPASVFCKSRGGRLEIVTGANGGQHGICVLPDGTRIEEWTYFRNAHRTTH